MAKVATRPTPFRAYLDGMPDVGQGGGWSERQWRRAPRIQVCVTDLVSINRGGYLDESQVARYVRKPPRRDVYVVEHRGVRYVADGHHRVVAAFRRGESLVWARVIRAG